MLAEFIRFCVVLVCFLGLTTLIAVFTAYLLGNTNDFDEEEFDGPWGKGVSIREDAQYDLFYRDAIARQKGLNLDGTPRRETMSQQQVLMED